MALAAPKQQHRKNFWSDRTEQELLDYVFTTTEPEKLEGISEQPPPPGEFRIERVYNVKGRPEGFAKCVLCKYPNHYRGFVVLFADSTRRLVGIDCGVKYYGGQFEDQERDFKAARELAASYRRRNKLLAAEPILADGLRVLCRNRALAECSRMSAQISRVLGWDLSSELRNMSVRGEPFKITQKVRDYAAEERAKDLAPEHVEKMAHMNRVEQKRYRKRHNLPDLEKYKLVDLPLGPVRGASMLAERFDPPSRFAELAGEITNSFNGLRLNRNWSSSSISIGIQRITELVDRLERDLGYLNAPIEFFDSSHLAALTEWAKHRPNPIEFRIGPGRIEQDAPPTMIALGLRDPDKAELLPGYSPPSCEFVSKFRKALE
jgi:hypothetical protein